MWPRGKRTNGATPIARGLTCGAVNLAIGVEHIAGASFSVWSRISLTSRILWTGYATSNNPIITDDLLKCFIFVLLLQRDMTVLSRHEYLSRPDTVSSYPSASSGISFWLFCVTLLTSYINEEIELNHFSHFPKRKSSRGAALRSDTGSNLLWRTSKRQYVTNVKNGIALKLQLRYLSNCMATSFLSFSDLFEHNEFQFKGEKDKIFIPDRLIYRSSNTKGKNFSHDGFWFEINEKRKLSS